jgi:hypothetical protein
LARIRDDFGICLGFVVEFVKVILILVFRRIHGFDIIVGDGDRRPLPRL